MAAGLGRFEANPGKWAGDEENRGNYIIGDWARQVQGSLAGSAGGEQVRHVRDSMWLVFSAHRAEDPGSLPGRGIEFLVLGPMEILLDTLTATAIATLNLCLSHVFSSMSHSFFFFFLLSSLPY